MNVFRVIFAVTKHTQRLAILHSLAGPYLALLQSPGALAAAVRPAYATIASWRFRTEYKRSSTMLRTVGAIATASLAASGARSSLKANRAGRQASLLACNGACGAQEDRDILRL